MSKFTLKVIVAIGLLIGAMLALRAAGAGFSSPPWTDGTAFYPKQGNQAERARQAWTSTWERAQVIPSGAAAEESTFWKSDRGNFRYWKAWVEANVGNFVDPTIVTNDTLDDWFAQNTSSNRPAMLSTNRLSEICSLGSDFWTNTPWKALAMNQTNGWPVVSNVMARLVYTVMDYTAATGTTYTYQGDSGPYPFITNSTLAAAISDAIANSSYSTNYNLNVLPSKDTAITAYQSSPEHYEVTFDTIKGVAHADDYHSAAAVDAFTPRQDLYAFGATNTTYAAWEDNGTTVASNAWKYVATTNGYVIEFDDLEIGAWGPEGGTDSRGWSTSDAFMLFYWGTDDGFEFK